MANHLTLMFPVKTDTRDQMLAALKRYDPSRLGYLAVRKKIMTPEEFEAVQNIYGADFLELGEKAVQAGLLTQEQLSYLVRLQKSDWRQLRENP